MDELTCVQGDFISTCPQPRTRGSDRCYFHDKIAAGLVACPYTPRPLSFEGGCALSMGHRGPHSAVSARELMLSPADILSDEQRELADGLYALGVSGPVVMRALAKESPSTPGLTRPGTTSTKSRVRR